MDSAEVVVETKAATITTRALFVKVESIIMVVWCCFVSSLLLQFL
jgi:hypothetical protein